MCFFFSCIFNCTITILLYLFLPSSLSLLLMCYNRLFSLPITLSASSHPLFPPSSPPPPILPQPVTTLPPPFYTLTTHWLAYCANYIKPQPLAIPDRSTLNSNNRNTPKHIQGSQNTEAPISLSQLTNPFSHHTTF
jgi:hypothetical protein